MDVCVESNFVLELALHQGQHESCQQLVQLARDGVIRLIVPAYSLTEPHETMTRRFRDRRTLLENVQKELRQLSRSQHYQQPVANQERGILELLATSQQEELERLRTAVQTVVTAATVVPLTAVTVTAATQLEDELGLSPQDSIVLASILHHLDPPPAEEALFLNRNSRDFNDPDLVQKLEERNCRAIFSFDDGLARVRALHVR